MTPAGFPHSGIHGSQLAFSFPWLFVDRYALLRLPVPRHPPCALSSLTLFLYSLRVPCTVLSLPLPPCGPRLATRFRLSLRVPCRHIANTKSFRQSNYSLRINWVLGYCSIFLPQCFTYITFTCIFLFIQFSRCFFIRRFASLAQSLLSLQPLPGPPLASRFRALRVPSLRILLELSLRWWAQVDSNHRPHAYQACALTT